MRAKSAVIKSLSAADINADENKIGLKGSPTWVSKIFTPPVKGNREIVTDENGSSAKDIVKKLKNLQLI